MRSGICHNSHNSLFPFSNGFSITSTFPETVLDFAIFEYKLHKVTFMKEPVIFLRHRHISAKGQVYVVHNFKWSYD